MAPAELRVACLALAKAERSFQESPDSYQTRDLAYIAERKSRMAEISAYINVERGRQTGIEDGYRAANGEFDTKTRESLSGANELPTAVDSEENGEMTAKRISELQKATAAADRREIEALAVLTKLVEVKQEPRGMVIVLSGSVLFASGQSILAPEARSLLDPVVDVLLVTRERTLIIEGHTDSQGLDSYNLDLSQRRADAVRDYLVQRDYQSDHIQSQGLGEEHPIADNATAEGRARNRRIEIIIERETLVSNKE